MNSIPNFLTIKREKIPRGFSYPLKTSELIAAYDSAEINTETILNYFSITQTLGFIFGLQT
ncbi:hypothetical protein LEP1GSC088_1110 [Leptospira interrogans str. L1207]|nr:hypothetical protein LEP1GSC088_1110 [Leptospira interrogans str. L1207]